MATAKAAEAKKRVQGAMKERLGANADVFTEGGMPDKKKSNTRHKTFSWVESVESRACLAKAVNTKNWAMK